MIFCFVFMFKMYLKCNSAFYFFVLLNVNRRVGFVFK